MSAAEDDDGYKKEPETDDEVETPRKKPKTGMV